MASVLALAYDPLEDREHQENGGTLVFQYQKENHGYQIRYEYPDYWERCPTLVQIGIPFWLYGRFFVAILRAIQRLTILVGKTKNKKSLLICIKTITALNSANAMRLWISFR